MTAALRLTLVAPARWIDMGVLDDSPFVNVVTGGFGSQVKADTDPALKHTLGGWAYVLTGLSRAREFTACRGRFTARDFSWEGSFLALAIGNGRQGGGGIPLCIDAFLDDGELDLMTVPELSRDARIDALGRFLHEVQAAWAVSRLPRGVLGSRSKPTRILWSTLMGNRGRLAALEWGATKARCRYTSAIICCSEQQTQPMTVGGMSSASPQGIFVHPLVITCAQIDERPRCIEYGSFAPGAGWFSDPTIPNHVKLRFPERRQGPSIMRHGPSVNAGIKWGQPPV